MKSTDIAHLLPSIFQRTLGARPDVLGTFLGLMENLHSPSEAVLAELDRYFLPDRTDDAYLFFLARWLDLDWLIIENRLPDSDGLAGGPTSIVKLSRLRRLIDNAVSLHRQRGTRAALVRFLEIATGLRGFNVWDDRHRPFHILVECPRNDALDPELVRLIVENERPAFVTFQLCQRGRPENLAQFLEIDTGIEGFVVTVQKAGGQSTHIVVECPRNANLEQVRQIVENEKPLDVSYELRQPEQDSATEDGGSG
jgi:phage tail-like protein